MDFLKETAHRPYKMPSSPWVMAQSWNQLLFAHWALPPEVMRPLIPPGLTLDTFEGQAYVGVVPFHITDIRPRGLPFFPLMSAFVELNVRTYVIHNGRPGVWFYSLDASNRFAVEGARRLFHLPYFMARMNVRTEGRKVHYVSHRTDKRTGEGDFVGTYRPTSAPYLSQPGTLDHWLTERYCLYSADSKGRLYRGEIHHAPWTLHHAEADLKVNTVTNAHGITLPDTPPILHYVERLDVVVWSLVRA